MDGPGFPVSGAQSCGLMQDVFQSFREGKRGVFYFSHSGTVLKFLAFLGLYRS